MRLIDDLCRWYRKFSTLQGDDSNSPPDTTAHATESSELLRAINITKGIEIAARVEWAGTSVSRRRGLLGRDHMDADQGMYIVPTQWIHMFGMRFPIDVAFLASDGRVLFIHHHLRPNRFSRPVWRAEGALELAAGVLKRSGTVVGDVVELQQA